MMGAWRWTPDLIPGLSVQSFMLLKVLASYPGPEKGPGIYCLRMRRHPPFLWGIGNYSNLVRVS